MSLVLITNCVYLELTNILSCWCYLFIYFWHKNTSHDVYGPDKILSVQYSIAGYRNNAVQLISKMYSSGEPETLCVVSRSVVSDSSWSHGLYPTKFLCLWDSPGKNTGEGSHSLLQRIFPTQGSNWVHPESVKKLSS